jgi:putative glutamine amidotransferase
MGSIASVTDRPRIGITTGAARDWLPGGIAYEPYATAIAAAGGEPLRLDPSFTGPSRDLIRELDGLLFTGGWDIDLRLYPRPPDLNGATPGEWMARRRMRTEPVRDLLELPLLQAAVEADLPVMGICRGCQVLHVALGGRLVLDIAGEMGSPVRHPAFPEPERLSSSHELSILEGTRLAALLPPEAHRTTNSRHHQAVLPEAGMPTKVVARCPADEVVEAVELPGRRFVLCVQWHPEHPKDPEIRAAHRPLFAALVKASRQESLDD